MASLITRRRLRTAYDVSTNIALKDLVLGGNQLTSIDVSSNTELSHLSLNNNQLTSIDVSSNTALTKLFLRANQLTTIDVSSNICKRSVIDALWMLPGSGRRLTTFDRAQILIKHRGFNVPR